MVGEFMPAEQDCLDGKRRVDTCEAETQRALADMKKELAVNKKEAQVKTEGEMINRFTIITYIGEINNRIKNIKTGKIDLGLLAKIKNPQFKEDIEFITRAVETLNRGGKLEQKDIRTLQSMLFQQAEITMKIYNSLSPTQQKEFLTISTVAV